MNNGVFSKPDSIDWAIIFGFGLMAGPFIIYTYYFNYKLTLSNAILVYLLNLIEYITLAITVVFWMIPTFFNRKKIGWFFLLLLLVFSVASLYDNLFFPLIIPNSPPFSFDTFMDGLFINGRQFGIIGAVLVGKRYLQYQQKYLIAEKEKTAAELKLLKSQINPHFLFNNLNILGALIQHDKEEAAAYLKRFAALYRYLLTNKENDTVLLSEELVFIEDYIFLLKKRFGKAYEFQIQQEREHINNVLIIPAAIQTLIENAVKHNRGEETNPLIIHILIDKMVVIVVNEIRPKFAKQVQSTGTGLENLTTRYRLLTEKSVKISQENGQFLVRLPLIKNLNNL